jgi:ketosteroid isomerase-like protein
MIVVITVVLALAGVCVGQNSNSSAPAAPGASRPRTTPPPAPQGNANTQTGNSGGQTGRARGNTPKASDLTTKGVTDAFDTLVAGIEKANVDMATNVYLNSPDLVLFNYNGTVTRGWAQMRKNRESSYPNMKDVKLTIRDQRIRMLSRDSALVTCLWTQSQTYKGTSETVSGRMTLVFQRINGLWKAVHLHTSNDAPDPSRVPQSEQPQTPPKQQQE